MKEDAIKDLEKKPVYRIFPKALEPTQQGICPTCAKKVTQFRDSLSRKEYGITGACQPCQDRIAKLNEE